MNQDIENIIRTNLPENKLFNGDDEVEYICECEGFNEALSQIDTKLIANEVLKVVGKFLFENLQSNHDKCPNKMTCIGYQSCVSDIENLLS